MRDYLAVAKALSDETRATILLMLQDGELCVCDVIAVLGLAPSTVSKHLSILHQARLLDSTKRGKWVYYRLANGNAPPTVTQGLDWVKSALIGTDIARDLKARLERLKQAKEEGSDDCSET